MSKCITFSGIITFIYICKWTRLYGFSRIKKKNRQGGGGEEDTATPRINIKRKPPKSFLPKRKARGKLRGLSNAFEEINKRIKKNAFLYKMYFFKGWAFLPMA